MGLNCGIVGLPNVGKSTIFSALTATKVEAENYPFWTIEPNIGIVPIDDPRLKQIAQYIKPRKTIPTVVEFVDIAGLVRGASKGEGLGNQFLGNIRDVDTIVHIVRCFEDSNVVHVNGRIDPIDDIEIINMELALSDLEVVNRRLDNIGKLIKSHDKKVQGNAKSSVPILEKLQHHLSDGMLARAVGLTTDDLECVNDLNLITLKEMLYVCNIDENSIDNSDHSLVSCVQDYAKDNNARAITICGKLEAEISALDSAKERTDFLKDVGIKQSGLYQLTSTVYHLLGLRTFFTAGEKEIRAWTFHDKDKAPAAAGVIHSDFERGFIKAEVYHLNDLTKYESEGKIRESGKMRIEGKEYLVQDGDIIHFRFNVS